MFQDVYGDMLSIDELCEMLTIGKNTALGITPDKKRLNLLLTDTQSPLNTIIEISKPIFL